MQNHRIVERGGTFSPECSGRKYFDCVIPAHQKQAAYYCELDIFVKVTGKRLGRNGQGQMCLVCTLHESCLSLSLSPPSSPPPPLSLSSLENL